MEYLCQRTRQSLVRAKNNLGETPLHLAVACTARVDRASLAGDFVDDDEKREMGLAVQVRAL